MPLSRCQTWHNHVPMTEDAAAGAARDGAAVLRRLLAQRGWTAKDLAEKADLSASSVRAYRAGKYVPSAPAAFQVAAVFKKDGAELLDAWEMPDAAEGLRSGKQHVVRITEGVGASDEIRARLRENDDIMEGAGFALPPDVQTLYYTGQELTEQNKKTVLGLIAVLQQQQPGASWYTRDDDDFDPRDEMTAEEIAEAKAQAEELGDFDPR